MNNVDMFKRRTARRAVEDMIRECRNPMETGIGVYHLIDSNGMVVYVGQTRSLKSRLTGHLSKKDFSSFLFYECNREDLNENEAIDIVKLNPPLNETLPSNTVLKTAYQLKKELNKITDTMIDAMVSEGVIVSEFTTKLGANYINRDQCRKIEDEFSSKLSDIIILAEKYASE